MRWNFEKFLVAPDGTVAARFAPTVEPGAAELRAATEKALPPAARGSPVSVVPPGVGRTTIGDTRDGPGGGGGMFFAVQEMLAPGQVPPEHHISIQGPLDASRVVLDAAVPDDVLRDHGRLRHLPPAPAHLDAAGRRRFVLEHLLARIDGAASYVRMSPADLPPFVRALIAAARPVVFAWTDPTTGERVERVVVAVWRDGDPDGPADHTPPGPRRP
ncbi:hypothetical protein [Micromonospora sp. C31]|uniref:hypothetical protein n=1 Tax=Micromonospora sp. C31 TaxID=2824876 RepID=UPI0035B3F690